MGFHGFKELNFMLEQLHGLRRVMRGILLNGRLSRVRRVLERKPLLLKIETINACNARCVFCPYEKMKRKKTILSEALYKKALSDYSELDGGPVSLTPVVGDFLLDPDVCSRLRIAREYQAITDLTFTTNLVAHERLSSEAWKYILSETRCVTVSLGGYDEKTYEELYGIDAFDVVMAGVRRLAKIRTEHHLKKVSLVVALRFRDEAQSSMRQNIVESLRSIGCDHVSFISKFSNWGGKVDDVCLSSGLQVWRSGVFRGPCVMPATALAVLSNGRITACSCVDCEGELDMGDIAMDSLSSVWTGEPLSCLRKGFSVGKVPSLCRACSFYSSSDEVLRMAPFLGATSQHLPESYYFEFGA